MRNKLNIYTPVSKGLEYTDCISADTWEPPPSECSGYDTKPSEGKPRNFGECRVTTLCDDSQVLSDLEW